MNSLRNQQPVDKDACIALVHGLQVDLSLLATWLAHTWQPELPHGSIEGLALLRNYLDAYTPCLTGIRRNLMT